MRTVKTVSGAIAVQIVYSSHRGSREIEHIGSAHDDVKLELLKAVARQRANSGRACREAGQPAGSWKCQMTRSGRPPAARPAEGR